MRFFQILMFLVLTAGTFAQHFVTGKVVETIPTSILCADKASHQKQFCNGNPVCDSNGLVHCTGPGKGVEYLCADTESPFCDVDSFGKAKCVKTQNPICAKAEENKFDCLSAGIFPNPTNCKKYYNCFDDGQGGLKADAYECENFYVFDPNFFENDYCRLSYNLFCVQADCSGGINNVLLNYPRYTKGQYIATCRANGKPPLVTKCDEGYVADLKTIPVQCKISCNGPAKFADPNESTKYFECIFDGTTWKITFKSCFRDHYFDKSSKQCILNPTTKKPPSSLECETKCLQTCAKDDNSQTCEFFCFQDCMCEAKCLRNEQSKSCKLCKCSVKCDVSCVGFVPDPVFCKEDCLESECQ